MLQTCEKICHGKNSTHQQLFTHSLTDDAVSGCGHFINFIWLNAENSVSDEFDFESQLIDVVGELYFQVGYGLFLVLYVSH